MVAGEALARYGFGDGHPFGPDRHGAFWREFLARKLDQRTQTLAPRAATEAELLLFHTPAHLERVRTGSASGQGFLDGGDTPAFRGVFEAAATVVGATLIATDALLEKRARRAFVSIAGLHHAGRNQAAGFCVFNDIGVAIEYLRAKHRVRRIAYIDIDAHHGDGVFYAFEDDTDLIFADSHEDGQFLYPGTGKASETGRGAAAGTKLNVPLPSGADDAAFAAVWPRMLAHVEKFAPEFIFLQAGVDSIAGDPITHLALTSASHRRVARDLCDLADRLGHGRVVATGGGGYNRSNIADGWNAVVEALLPGAAVQ